MYNKPLAAQQQTATESNHILYLLLFVVVLCIYVVQIMFKIVSIPLHTRIGNYRKLHIVYHNHRRIDAFFMYARAVACLKAAKVRIAAIASGD